MDVSATALRDYVGGVDEDIKNATVLALDNFLVPGMKNYQNIIKLCNNANMKRLLCDNYVFWSMLWLRYVSSELPTKNLDELKRKYKEAMEIYNAKEGKPFNEFGDIRINAEKLGYFIMSHKVMLSELLASKINENGNFANNMSYINSYLIQGADLNLFPEVTKSLLFHSIYKMNDKEIKYWIDRGADIDAESIMGGHTILEHLITYAKDEEDLLRIKKAIEYGADVNKRSHYGSYLVFNLLRNIFRQKEIRFKILDVFINNGLDLRVTDRDGDSVLESVENVYPENETEALVSLLKGEKPYYELFKFDSKGNYDELIRTKSPKETKKRNKLDDYFNQLLIQNGKPPKY